jgi:serine/threonine protein kinase
VLKDLCLSNNPLREISSADHLTKLKVLVANGCRLQNVSLNKLESLELLSLADNQLTAVPKMSNLQKLVNLDLSGNPLSVGFEELENLKSLQVLDLARTGLDITIQQLFQFVVTPLKKLPKLAFVSFAENPVEVAIIKFRLFIISELPKLKYMDWQAVGKDERSECVKQERLWRDDKVVPAAPLKMPILVSRATRMGAGRAGAGASSVEQQQQQVLGPDDKALVNFLLGDDAGGSSGAGGQAVKSKDSMLDDFLHETTADPLNDIMSYLSPEKTNSAQSGAAGGGGGGAGGGDYEDELMRIIYGDKPRAKQQELAPPDDDIFTTITADLDAALGFGPGDSVPTKPLQAPKKAAAAAPPPSATSVADTDLDDLLNSIIAVEERKGAPASAASAAAKPASGIDALLAQEEGAKQRRLEEERARVEQERARLEQERAELEQEKKRELEREKARLRAEMEAQKQREIDAARAADLEKQQSNKSGKNTQALENEAMAMLDMMEEVANGGGVGSAPTPAVASLKAPPPLSKEEQDADDLLASIDALVSGPSPAAGVAAKAPVVPKVATPPPVEKKVFGPRSPAVGVKLPSAGAALPIARRRRDDDDDDDLESLLSEAKAPEAKKVVAGGTLAYWSQLNFGDRLGIGTLGVTSVGWCRSSEVTVKKLKLQRFTDEFLKRFQEEVPLLVSLQHPNIVRFVGVCLDDSLCLLQQYIRGCSLYGYLRNEGNLVDLPFITNVSRGVAAGIAYLHSKKVYHRNLHSKNVILDGEMVPKLRDYGMQYIKNETYQLAMGPVQYEAPELLSRSPHTEAVDAFAFGVLLWELFCRELPYKHLQPTAIKEQVLADELRPDITPDIPVVFRRLMGACWNTDPSRRPTFLVVGKILSKPASELGAYGSEGGPTAFAAPKLQGPAAGRAAAPAVDLVAALDAPAVADSTTALMDKIASLLNSDDRLTQQRGLRVTYNLCEKAEYRERLHLMKVLVGALIAKSKSGVEKVTRDLAMQALGKICVAGENAEEFLQCLGWPVLLDALDSMDVTLELSASMLMVVLLKNAQNKDAFVSVKAVPVLVKLLFSETENVKTNAVWAASLALENEQTQKQFVAEGGVPVLLRLAQSQNPGVVLRVLLSVGLLLTNPTVFHELKDSGVIQRFVRLLSSPSPLLQQHGAEVMVRFCQNADLREVLYRNNAIDALLELLAATTDMKLKKLVVSALSCYLDEDTQMAYIEQTQALRPIVRLMVSNDADLRMEALRMISKAAGIPELRSQLMTMGAISPLAQMLNVKDKQLRMAVLYSLCVLSEDEAVAVAVALADGCAQLVRLCSSSMDDVDVLELAAETFANLSRSQQGVSQMRECSAFPLLVKLINHPNPKVVEGAANAFVQASSLPEGRLTIVALDGVEKLLSLCNSNDESLRESVLWSCPNWCSEQSTAELVATVALPSIVRALSDSKENMQSIAVKTVLLLCASGGFKTQLGNVRAKEALQKLEKTTANPTLKVAAGKALTFLA